MLKKVMPLTCLSYIDFQGYMGSVHMVIHSPKHPISRPSPQTGKEKWSGGAIGAFKPLGLDHQPYILAKILRWWRCQWFSLCLGRFLLLEQVSLDPLLQAVQIALDAHFLAEFFNFSFGQIGVG